MGLSGLEPPTSRLSGARSNLLSYKPILGAIQIPSIACGCFPLVEMMGFEPMTPCLQGRCSPNWATPPLVWLFFDFTMNIEAENAKHSLHSEATSFIICETYGGVAQLGEHLPCKQGVMGSNPIISIQHNKV